MRKYGRDRADGQHRSSSCAHPHTSPDRQAEHTTGTVAATVVALIPLPVRVPRAPAGARVPTKPAYFDDMHVTRSPRATSAAVAALPALAPIALAAVLNTWALGQNGYANVYYSAGVKSMLLSWHNFFFLAADPAGLVSIDKPPLGLWVQVASAKLFGYAPLSLLLPQALMGVVAVAALYAIMRKRYGTLAACAGALTLAVFPAFVAVARDNNVDTLLILLMTLACGATLRAIETGRLRTLLVAAVLLALAFNTKALAAYLVVPGIAAGYLYCAPNPPRRRVGHLLLAGLVCGVLSLAWMVAVDLTPASQRPFVGSSTDNSELGLTFGYNGFGRVGGQKGGPGPVADEEVAPQAQSLAASAATGVATVRLPRPSPDTAPKVPATITAGPVAFGTAPGPLRLFLKGFGDQCAWMLAFALIGLVAVARTRPARGDPRLAALIVFGGFLLCEAGFLSLSKGIVHPYYVSALGPGVAVMAGLGLAAMVGSARRSTVALMLAAVLVTAVVQILLLRQAHYLAVWQLLLGPAALAAALVAVIARRRDRYTRASLGLVLAVLLVAPTAYAASTWRKPVQGTFPAAGPRAVGGNGGAELSRPQLASTDALMRYLLAHGASARFQLLTQASLSADGPILLGLRASAIGGYGGVDPALDGPGLGRLVASGQARYLLLGGSYDYLGGNAASRAAARVCPQVPPAAWGGVLAHETEGVYLVDCAGRARQLAGR
jgi:4-amino-4-deoxy-L-arabinose transferase-like glycosyltransferase